jgi:tRNA U34 5-methylaminomethyl-2-thiouridine-forming methyltransferase MnmC
MQNKINEIYRELQMTADGSHTLFIPEMDEHYHSVNGAVQESRHVFIEAGLHHLPQKTVNVLEIGFGTGLNAFLTVLDSAATASTVYYYSFELYPLSLEVIEALNYGEMICKDKNDVFHALHTADWNRAVKITENFTLYKIQGDSNREQLPEGIDLVYFDAFAPDKQPEMWNQEIFNKLFAAMNPGGILTTYCAKGMVRRMMKEAGYSVERIPGPPGKREMLRATKL